MYNYKPIGIYSAKSLADEEREKRNKKSIFDHLEKEPQQKKKNVNLLIVTDYTGKYQFDDTVNTIWEIRQISTFANYETFIDLCKRFNFKNIAFVHHGNVFSEKENYPDHLKVIIDSKKFNLMRKSFDSLPKQDLLTLNDEYFESFKKVTEKYAQGGLELKEIKAYISLRLLFDNMLDNSNFFSVACDEAEDKDFLKELGAMTNKKMKIFANSNFTKIDTSRWFPAVNPYIKDFGSILNSFLTTPKSWIDANGWYYLDTSSNTITITKKDLWLYSANTKIYELIKREKNFTPEQAKRVSEYQIYYSKKFKEGYVKHNSQKQYDLLMKQILKDNPDIIQKK